MKKQILGLAISLGAFTLHAQQTINGHFYGEDALKFSKYSTYGTARSIGMGNAFSALGGDASSAIINPAGLAFYNRSEFSISPVFLNQNTSTNYINQNSELASSMLNIGQASWITSKVPNNNKQKRSVVGLSYTRLANFHNQYNYSGVNNKSSIQDFFAEKANSRNVPPSVLDSEFDTQTSQAATNTALYYQAFLIDPFEDGYVVLEPSFPVNQSGSITESGGLGQINLSYALNLKDKTYFGLNVGVQNLNYNMVNNHNEVFPNAEAMRGFGYTDDLIVKGTGINLTLGGIIKATEDVRMGLSVTSPTFMGIKETIVSAVRIDPIPSVIQTSFTEISTLPSDFNYKMTSPLRANGGISYMLPKTLGVISAEAEYIGYSKMNIKDRDSNSWSTEQKREIQQVYKDVINLKTGAELRFGNARLRAGVNYLPSVVKISDGLNREQVILTTGAGYRSGRFFADVAFSTTKNENAFTPYTLSNPENYASAQIDNRLNSLTFSIGTFF